MQLKELSSGYEEAAVLLQTKLRELRKALRSSPDPQERARLRHEIAFLSGILTQCRQLRALTAHYYERSFYRDKRYTL